MVVLVVVVVVMVVVVSVSKQDYRGLTSGWLIRGPAQGSKIGYTAHTAHDCRYVLYYAHVL